MTLAKWSLFVISILAKDVVSIQTCADKWKGWGNSCYLFVRPAGANYDPKPSNWNMARAYCLKKGADLVSLTTNDEVDFVYSHTKNLAYWFWIGLRYNRTKLRKNSHWAWSNGDKLNITKWNTGEPNYLDREHCVEILERLKVWNNEKCDNEKRAWICEKPKSVKTSWKTVKITATAPSKETTTTMSTNAKALSKPTTTPKSTNAKPSIITSTKVVPKTTRKSTEEDTKPTKAPSKRTTTTMSTNAKALSKPTTTPKSTNAKPSIITSTKAVPKTTRKSTEEDTKPTKDQSSDTNSSTMSISMALYIFLPMILLALIIVLILLVRKKRASNKTDSPREENNREMENQGNNNQTFTESEVYTELHHNREPDNTYSSLNLYENPDDNSGRSYVNSGRSYVIGNNINYINQEAQRRFSYVIPPPSHNYEIPDYR